MRVLWSQAGRERERSPQPAYKHTAMRTNCRNMLALSTACPGCSPRFSIYIDHRREVIRAARASCSPGRERAHILEGFLKALSMLDAIIEAIRNSPSPAAARDRLQEAPFEFSERQAQAILDLTLSRLTQLERQKIQEEYEAVIKEIAYLREILENPRRVFELIKDDLEDIKKRHGDARRTEIKAVEADDIDIADLIKEEDMVVTMTRTATSSGCPLTYQYRTGRQIPAQQEGGGRCQQPVHRLHPQHPTVLHGRWPHLSPAGLRGAPG